MCVVQVCVVVSFFLFTPPIIYATKCKKTMLSGRVEIRRSTPCIHRYFASSPNPPKNISICAYLRTAKEELEVFFFTLPSAFS